MALAATVGGGVVVLAWMRDPETIGAGLLIAIPLLAAIIGFVLLSAILPDHPARHVGFWIPFLLLLGLFVPAAVFPSAGASGDGADQMARMVMTALATGGLAAYVSAIVLRLTRPAQLRKSTGNICTDCGYPVGSSPVCTECGRTLPER